MWKNYTVIILPMPVFLWEYFTIVLLMQKIVYYFYWSILFITEAYYSTIIVIYPQKKVETVWVSNVFGRNRKKQLTCTGLHSTDFYSTWNKIIKPYRGDSPNTNSPDFEKIQLSIDFKPIKSFESGIVSKFRFYFEVNLNELSNFYSLSNHWWFYSPKFA